MNNFQSIRNDLFHEVGEIQDRERRDQQMVEFAEELDNQRQVSKQKYAQKLQISTPIYK